MSLALIGLLFLAGFASGAINAVAGGGTFITFGALSLAGVPPIAANATSSVTQFPGYVTSTLAYRHDIRRFWRGALLLAALSAVGALAGSAILLVLDNDEFRLTVPWLLLGATALFAAGPWLKPRNLGRTPAGRSAGSFRSRTSLPMLAYALHRLRSAPRRNRKSLAGSPPQGSIPGSDAREGAEAARVGSVPGAIVQFLTAVYGGFFGAGMGVMMLATLGLTQPPDYHRLNALKNLLSIVIASVAIAVFVAGGVVDWRHAAAMVPGTALGGYAGVWAARRVPQTALRVFVILVGLALSAYYFATAG